MRVTIYIPTGLLTAARDKVKGAFDKESGDKTFSVECTPIPGPDHVVTHNMANFESIGRPVLRNMKRKYGEDIASGVEGEFPGAKVYIDTPVADSLVDMNLKIKRGEI